MLEPLEHYLKSFAWNKVKYRADKPLAELIDLLQKVRLHVLQARWPMLRMHLGNQFNRQRRTRQIQPIQLRPHKPAITLAQEDRQPSNQVPPINRQPFNSRARL